MPSTQDGAGGAGARSGTVGPLIVSVRRAGRSIAPESAALGARAAGARRARICWRRRPMTRAPCGARAPGLRRSARRRCANLHALTPTPREAELLAAGAAAAPRRAGGRARSRHGAQQPRAPGRPGRARRVPAPARRRIPPRLPLLARLGGHEPVPGRHAAAPPDAAAVAPRGADDAPVARRRARRRTSQRASSPSRAARRG